MVYFVRNRFTRLIIDRLLDCERFFVPTLRSNPVSETLSALRLSSSRADDLFDRNRLIENDLFQFCRSVGKIDLQDRLGMRDEFDLITFGSERVEHPRNSPHAGAIPDRRSK